MGNFFAELKRRNIYRVGAAYAVVAWILLQLAANVSPILDLPPWIARTILLLLLIGFPVALVLAWTVEPKSPAPAAQATNVDFVLAGSLIVVIVLVLYQQLAPVSGTTTATREPRAGAARDAAASPIGAISIVVLPFANLSGDASQEYFSDGITEEITSALAKVPDLRVVARTSAYQFRAQNRDIQTIGQQLHATHFIEGSVRKAGDRLRITAQLIKADDGTHIWAEDYDRQLTDIFAIQDEIARAITASLRVPLGLQPGQTLVSNRSIDPESYQQYLRARALVRGRASGGASLKEAGALLESVVARNPNYAPAWAQLALAYGLTPAFDRALSTGTAEELRRVVDASLPKAEKAAQRAIELDPALAEGYLSLGRVQDLRGKPLLAEDYFTKALTLDPNNPDGLSLYGSFLVGAGRVKEGLAREQRALTLEPFVQIYNLTTARMLAVNGQTDAAIAMLRALPPSPEREIRLAQIHAAVGRFNEAADALSGLPVSAYPPGTAVDEGVRLLRAAPSTVASPQSLPRLLNIDFIYLYVGAPERVFEWDERNAEAGLFQAAGAWFYWQMTTAPVRKTERFKAHMRKIGIVDYWRARGWPDLCRPMGTDDFVCE